MSEITVSVQNFVPRSSSCVVFSVSRCKKACKFLTFVEDPAKRTALSSVVLSQIVRVAGGSIRSYFVGRISEKQAYVNCVPNVLFVGRELGSMPAILHYLCPQIL